MIVVSPEEPSLFKYLSECFLDFVSVRVVQDRRHAERRHPTTLAVSEERYLESRHGDRRQQRPIRGGLALVGWEVVGQGA
ncbi:MAG: hypothetical protein HYR86_02750 [Candidatus Rokubacteria bacterium]|nr:hypothetical protein [Candidatus Rokubacteria bacterium]